jgi:putative membrane protein
MIALNKYSEKGVKLTIYITTIAVCALVVVLNQKWIPHPDTFPSFIYKLPMVNAFLNGTCTLYGRLKTRIFNCTKN